MKNCIILILLLCTHQTTTAGMYKCKNSDEQISYSDKPCVVAQSQQFNLPYFSPSHLSNTTTDSPNSPNAALTAKRLKHHPFLSEQEFQLLQTIDRREKKREKLEQWKEKQRYKSALREAARHKKQHKINLKKCNKTKDKLKKIQKKARSGYRASESNKINNTISRNKKYLNKFCK